MSSTIFPDHVLKPHLRPVQPLPLEKDGQKLVALRDPMMLSRDTLIVPPQALPALQSFQGQMTLEELASKFSAPVEQVAALAQGLDRVGLLWGPTFEELETQCKQRIATAGAFPVTASGSLGADDSACREAIKNYLNETEDPELDAEIVGLVAPHLDYERGWPNFAAAYYSMKHAQKPDRVVILGTNHYGIGDGVVGTEFGFQSPMGTCAADKSIIDALSSSLGKPYTIDQLDHIAEHSIQLQLPWIQYFFGNVPVIGALIPDPVSPKFGEESDERTKTEDFIKTLRDAVNTAGGRTLFVASADLSHVGPQFGEPRSVDDQRKFDVERHDREMLAKFLSGDAEDFVSAMKWNKNPTHWCSIGNMAALLQIVEPSSLELIDYRQACDERGMALVSSAAIVLH